MRIRSSSLLTSFISWQVALVVVLASPVRAGLKPLHEAILKQDLDKVRNLAGSRSQIAAKEPTLDGFTPLHLAVCISLISGDARILEALLKEAASNAKDDYGRTPLHVALDLHPLRTTTPVPALSFTNTNIPSEFRVRSVAMLLGAGADVNAKDKGGRSVLSYALESADRPAIDLLMEKGPRLEGIAIHSGVKSRHFQVVERLLERPGANLNKPDSDQNDFTALHYAASDGEKEIVALLLKHDAEVNARAYIRHYATNEGIVRWRLSAATPLDLALMNRHTEVAEQLKQAGGKPAPVGVAGESLGKKQDDEDKGLTPEQKKSKKRWAAYSTSQLIFKLDALERELARGYWGQGIGLFIMQGHHNSKVRERDAIAMEIIRRIEAGDAALPDPGKRRSPTPKSFVGTGTGFFITNDGYLLTAAHVVNKGSTFFIKTPDGFLKAELVNSDTRNDVAVLRVKGVFPAIPLAPSDEVALGNDVFTVGFPDPQIQGYSPKLTKGHISSLAGLSDDPTRFQVSVPIQPGNSGGALVNSAGNVIGLAVSSLTVGRLLREKDVVPQNVNYAVKSSIALNLIRSVPGLHQNLSQPHNDNERPFAEVAKEVEAATVLVLVASE